MVSVQRIRDFGAQPSMGCLYHTSPLKVQGGGAERIKSQISRKQCFPQQGRCTHELTSVITLCTRPAKPQSSQTKTQHDGEGRHEATPSGGTIRYDYYCKRKSQLASVV